MRGGPVALAFLLCLARAAAVSLTDADGETRTVAELSDGKEWVLVVNTATECGYTFDNFRGLKRLQNEVPEVKVLLVPSNTFRQEPRDVKGVKAFCDRRFGADFHVLQKVDVHRDEHFAELLQQPYEGTPAGAGGTPPRWNFEKWLLHRGEVVARYQHTLPMDAIQQRVAERVGSLAGGGGGGGGDL